MSALDATLKALHTAVAENLLDLITNGVPTQWDEEGNETARRKATAPEFQAAIAFLKNNDITANLDETEATKALRDALEARRKKQPLVMPDMLSDAGMH